MTRPEAVSRDRIGTTPIEYGLLIAGLSIAILATISAFSGPPDDSVDTAQTHTAPADRAAVAASRNALR